MFSFLEKELSLVNALYIKANTAIFDSALTKPVRPKSGQLYAKQPAPFLCALAIISLLSLGLVMHAEFAGLRVKARWDV